jgi:hypothetical protein
MCSCLLSFACFFDCAEKWQTLIGSLIALTAALIALKPVYGQLRAANLQAAVAMRGTLAEKIRLLETRREKIDVQGKKLMNDLLYHERIDHKKLFQWAWGMESHVSTFREFLDQMIEDKIEHDEAGIALSNLQRSADSLADCMVNINLEQHLDIGHAEVTDEHIKLSAQAESELGDKITALRLDGEKLGDAYGVVLDELRMKIRSLDESIRKQSGTAF